MNEFKRMVQSMRDAQNAYFANRTPANLTNAKFWEKRVDAELKANVEPSLFGQ